MSRRQDLIDTALKLFYTHGIHAVGINQILEEAGVAKQTLYNHFESKDSLVVAAVERRDDLFFEWLKGRVDSKAPGEEALLEMFDAVDDWVNGRVPSLSEFHGCFFINACGEYSDPSHPVHQRCADHKTRVFKLILEQVEKIKGAGTQAEELANALFMLKEGVIVKAHVEGDSQAAVKAREIARSML